MESIITSTNNLMIKKDDASRSLIELQPGDEARVFRLNGPHSEVARLASLGFTPGVQLKLLRVQAGGPYLVSLRGGEVALGGLEASHVMVARVDAATVQQTGDKTATAHKEKVIALAGQPNVGKSSVFNLLTGLNQHVGNWTGKTVEQKTGGFKCGEFQCNLVDLPGTYSLTAASEEERIARDFILRQKPDLVLAVVDAASLERSLYLVAELLILSAPIVLILNMMDVAIQEGYQIEPQVLESALGIPVVPMSAARGKGQDELQAAVEKALAGKIPSAANRPSILPAHKQVLQQLEDLIRPFIPEIYPVEWAALKLLEGDEEMRSVVEKLAPGEVWEEIQHLLYQHEDAVLDVAGARYEWIARMVRAAVVQPLVTRGSFTTRIDRVLTHPVWGMTFLLALLGGVFWLTFAIGTPVQAWLSARVIDLANLIRAGLPHVAPWLVGFFAGGLLGGIGMVLTFLPILAVFYFVLGFLEDTGYMARAAYLTDRWLHSIGLHGKSFLPILLGFGCNVPAVLGTRIIENKRARLLTILLIPLIPCTARLAVITVLTPLFFGSSALWVSWGLVALNIVILGGLGWLLHHFVFEDEHVPFIMELPLYHVPNMKTIGIYVWQNLVGFLQKAGTIILAASLVVWVVSYFPSGNVQTSFLSYFGRWIEPVGLLIGLPWPVLIALITSFAAKENTIATLGVLYGSLSVLPQTLLPAAALSMLVFQMLFIPCVGTVAAVRSETNSWKWTVFSLALMLLISFLAALIVFQVGSRL
jgi:ferrous iron transport protein B